MKKLLLSIAVLFIGLSTFSAEIDRESLRFSKQHPYLISDKDDFEMVKKAIAEKKSNVVVLMHNEVMKSADAIVKYDKVMSNKLEGDRRMLGMARDFCGRVFNCAYAYRFSGERKYLEAAEKLLYTVCTFPDWNPVKHYLDTSTIMTGVGIAYDWLYEDLSEDLRVIVEKAALKLFLEDCLGKAKNHLQGNASWVSASTSGAVVGALAFYSLNEELCLDILQRAIGAHVDSMPSKYGKDGSFQSGAGYWTSGLQYVSIMDSSLLSVYGTDFGVSDYSGFKLTANWYLNMGGNTGKIFNFGDNGLDRALQPGLFYYAGMLKNPDFAYFEVEAAKKGVVRKLGPFSPKGNVTMRSYPIGVIWASRCDNLEAGEPAPGVFAAIDDVQPVVTCRSGWGREDAYMAIKGGKARLVHGHMDAGSFCYELAGFRWLADPGCDNYTPLEVAIRKLGTGSLWDFTQNGLRWTAFRINARQHNTFTVNGLNHNVDGDARVTEVFRDLDRMGATVNLDNTFEGQLAHAKRTALLIDSNVLQITDHIETLPDKAAHIRWNYCTPATPDVSKKGIDLNAEGKTLSLKVKSKYKVKYQMYPNDPRKAEVPSPFCDAEAFKEKEYYCGYTIDIPAGKAVDIVTTFTLFR